MQVSASDHPTNERACVTVTVTLTVTVTVTVALDALSSLEGDVSSIED